MTLEERGAYITLLGYAWINVGIPLDEKKIRRILGISPHKFSKIWPEVLPKFFPLYDRYVNPRMEEERGKQLDFRRSQSEKGKAGARARWKNDGDGGDSRGIHQAMAEDVAKGLPENGSSSTSSSSLLNDHTTTFEFLSSLQHLQPVVTRAESDDEVRAELERLKTA